jgi:thiamine-monophosphate kinase
LSSVEELGERKIIEILLKCLEPMPNLPIPFGDDVSAVDIGHGSLAVIKTDMLVGATDVPLGMTLSQAARKAVVMNISDLAAKGVSPIAVLVSLGLPRGLTRYEIEQLGKGLNDGAREYNAYILGGDTGEASDLVISCALFGVGKKRYLMKRDGARPGNIVAVTGLFGKTACGLRILTQGFSAPLQTREEFVNAVFMPHARLKEGLALAQTKAVTSSIDSSDGLAWSIHEISKVSNVGFIIDSLPIDHEVEGFARIHGLDPVELSLYGGEEYELLVTIEPEHWEVAKRALDAIRLPLIKIGTVTKEKRILLSIRGETTPIEAKGWEHFKSSK